MVVQRIQDPGDAQRLASKLAPGYMSTLPSSSNAGTSSAAAGGEPDKDVQVRLEKEERKEQEKLDKKRHFKP